jgi:hypothetical protein
MRWWWCPRPPRARTKGRRRRTMQPNGTRGLSRAGTSQPNPGGQNVILCVPSSGRWQSRSVGPRTRTEDGRPPRPCGANRWWAVRSRRVAGAHPPTGPPSNTIYGSSWRPSSAGGHSTYLPKGKAAATCLCYDETVAKAKKTTPPGLVQRQR